jgi:hypothetical protein
MLSWQSVIAAVGIPSRRCIVDIHHHAKEGIILRNDETLIFQAQKVFSHPVFGAQTSHFWFEIQFFCKPSERLHARVGICLGRDASLVAGLTRNNPGNLLRPQANIRVGRAKKKPRSTDM